MRQRAVHQRFLKRLVRVFILHVLPDDADSHDVFRVIDAVHQIMPFGKIAILGLQMQIAHRQRVHFFVREHDRHFVDRSHVFGGDDGLFLDVAEERDLPLDVFREEAVGAAEQNIGLNSDAEQFFHGVLRRLGLQFLRGGDEGNQRDVDEQRVLTAEFLAHLADRFDERQRFDVAHRAADFDQQHIHVLRAFLGTRP